MQAMLSSLHFLFRVEETPATAKAGAAYRISDVDLASRLSFFLWGTIPDKRTDRRGAPRRAVAAGSVRSPGPAHARRPAIRSARHAVRVAVAAPAGPAQGRARRADVPVLRRTARRARCRARPSCCSTISCAPTGRSLELLTADYTFVNERLARHYGIAGVSGSGVPQGVVSGRQAARPARTRAAS